MRALKTREGRWCRGHLAGGWAAQPPPDPPQSLSSSHVSTSDSHTTPNYLTTQNDPLVASVKCPSHIYVKMEVKSDTPPSITLNPPDAYHPTLPAQPSSIPGPVSALKASTAGRRKQAKPQRKTGRQCCYVAPWLPHLISGEAGMASPVVAWPGWPP